MKILLIYPDRYINTEGRRIPPILAPPLNLLTVGALTPDDVEVELIDERIEEIPWDKDFDLVGITALTADAPRAYQISDKFRKRGTKVVLGGMHISVMEEEALQHADSVVIGEAEILWEKLIGDFRKNQLKRVYKSDRFPDLSFTPPQRRDLLSPKARYLNTLQTTRGCPYNCSFCSVPRVFGRKIRTKPLNTVFKEIIGFKGHSMFIIDDNILSIPSYIESLFDRLKEFRKKWLAQASINLIGKYDKLLKLAKKAGCQGFFVGLETIKQENLKKFGKTHNIVEKYKEIVKKAHDFGVGIVGSFMFGFDDDDSDVFPYTMEFIKKAKIDLASFSILTPLPGTPFFEQMEKEGRILTRDWSKYDGAHAVFRTGKISPYKLQEGAYWMYKEFYKIGEIMKRIIQGIRYVKLLIPFNFAYHMIGREGLSDFHPKKSGNITVAQG